MKQHTTQTKKRPAITVRVFIGTTMYFSSLLSSTATVYDDVGAVKCVMLKLFPGIEGAEVDVGRIEGARDVGAEDKEGDIDGPTLGLNEGSCEKGAAVGAPLEIDVGWLVGVGMEYGGRDGAALGGDEGEVLDALDGADVKSRLGVAVGDRDGDLEGDVEGTRDGLDEGRLVARELGDCDG